MENKLVQSQKSSQSAPAASSTRDSASGSSRPSECSTQHRTQQSTACLYLAGGLVFRVFVLSSQPEKEKPASICILSILLSSW